MKTNCFWFLILTAGVLPLLTGCSEKRNADLKAGPATSTPAPSPSATTPTFTVCSGTYALCTKATCTIIPPSNPGEKERLSCSCDVKQGYSAGTKPCKDVPRTPVRPGESIPSRYFPITSTAVCQNSRRWAMCLDSQCTVDKDDPSKATCTCDEMITPNQPYVVFANSYSGSTCTSDIWSSATVEDVIQITGYLQDSTQLKPFPITIVGVGAEKK